MFCLSISLLNLLFYHRNDKQKDAGVPLTSHLKESSMRSKVCFSCLVPSHGFPIGMI